jgi:hypothetical protein
MAAFSSSCAVLSTRLNVAPSVRSSGKVSPGSKTPEKLANVKGGLEKFGLELLSLGLLCKASFVEAAFSKTGFATGFAKTGFAAGFAEAGFAAGFAEAGFAAGFAEAGFAAGFAETGFAASFAETGFDEARFGAGAGFGLEAFKPGFGLGFLVLAASNLGLGVCTPAFEGFFAFACFLGTSFATAVRGLAGFCFVGETETLVFFFKLWPEEVFFFPPALMGVAFLGEIFRVLFFFEEADLAADLGFLLATLSP